jgi:hypothetical protein
MRKKARKYKMPLLFIDRKPTIPADKLIRWWEKTKEYSARK